MNTRNLALTTMLIFLITLEVLIALNYVSQQKELNYQRTNIYTSVYEMHHQIGYVGLIHNIKNYILRPDQIEYREKAIENYHAALAEVENLETHGEYISESFQLSRTREMLHAYKIRLDRLPGLIERNLSAREIDELLRYDDEPSYLEIRHTSEIVVQALEDRLGTVLYRSLTSGFITLLAIIATLIAMIRFFFGEQKRVLEHSQSLNLEMETHEKELVRSQNTMLNIIDDINLEKRRTAALNIQLSLKNTEMEQFIYTVSHDLKSPLVTIGGFAKQLSKELSETATERQQHRLQRICDNVNQMERLLGDLLELSRVAKQEIKKVPVKIEDVVAQQCIGLEGLIKETGTTIKVSEPLHTFHCNETLVSQCLLNLMSNAMHYRDLDRPLIIEISSKKDESHTILSVKDNGAGIDSKYHKLIFRIFESLSKGSGTGVGLTIVKTVMDKHQGSVTLESQVGKGSCFHLAFPNVNTWDKKE